MKKIILAVITVMGVVTILGLVINAIPKESSSDDLKTEKNNDGDMKYIAYGSTSNYENGYFYIKDDHNIMFFDYDTQKEVYLCNKPNCKHEDNTCSSYLEIGESNELFYYDHHLYLINAQASGSIMSITGHGDDMVSEDQNGTPSTVYRMNLDGTNKEKLFVAPTGTEMSMPYVIKGNVLYGFLQNYKTEQKGNNSFASVMTDSKLVAIDLDTGKYEEIMDGVNKELVAVYDNQLVIQEIEYKNDPALYDDDPAGYIDNLYDSKTRVQLINIDTKKADTVYDGSYKDVNTLRFYKDRMYFVRKDSNNLEYMNLATKERKTITELPKSGMELSQIIDDKLLVYDYKDQEAHIGDAYVMDLNTQEMKEFALKDDNEYLVEILSGNDEYYFVQTENILGEEYTTWAGTRQQDIIGIRYGLIKKADYWASQPNYILMRNAE